jgi:hypothetical protein
MCITGPTLLRRMRTVSIPSPSSVRVLGIDDWSWKKGVSYGTILVDLELPNEEQEGACLIPTNATCCSEGLKDVETACSSTMRSPLAATKDRLLCSDCF